MASAIRSSRYELIAEIAKGGMGTVYVGRIRGAAGFSRLVAIKHALPHVAEDDRTRSAIADEARIAAKIHHRNVVSVLDVEEHDGELLLVMDYIEGASLSQLLRVAHRDQRSIDADVAIAILLDACDGLHAAHVLKDDGGQPLRLVHRDVSPQNILVGVDGTARLTDFGVAKSVEGGSPATSTGVLKGKVAYMAPEYIEGDRIDARADQFAIGAIAWELLAGKPLFQASRVAQTLNKVLHHEPDSLRDYGVSRQIDDVVHRALEKDPRKRFSTCRSLRRALAKAARAAGLSADRDAVTEMVESLIGEALSRRRQKWQSQDTEPGETVGVDPVESPQAAESVQPVDATEVLPDSSNAETRLMVDVDTRTDEVSVTLAVAPQTATSVDDEMPSSLSVMGVPRPRNRWWAVGAVAAVAAATATFLASDDDVGRSETMPRPSATVSPAATTTSSATFLAGASTETATKARSPKSPPRSSVRSASPRPSPRSAPPSGVEPPSPPAPAPAPVDPAPVDPAPVPAPVPNPPSGFPQNPY